ncbi:calcium-binding protein [Leisingera sp. XS_AS12]|uniref:calcium-binding protein n=1 Tax=Leisingera sp. XS_AS12 TaxID=3241294 RepID=UPI00351750B2
MTIDVDLSNADPVPDPNVAAEIFTTGDGVFSLLDAYGELPEGVWLNPFRLSISGETTPSDYTWEFDYQTGNVAIDPSQFAHIAPGEILELTLVYSIQDLVRYSQREVSITVTGRAPDIHSGDDGIAEGTDDGEDVYGGEGDDTISAGGGDDDVSAGNGSDVLDGGEGADSLDGGAGNDTLSGGEGDDRLEGGEGNDVLEGGEGLDTYVLAPGSGEDRIIDDGGVIEMLADIPDEYLLMTLYEVNGKTELHIDLLDEDGNKTGDRLIIENFNNTSGGPSGGSILDWVITPPGGGDEPMSPPNRVYIVDPGLGGDLVIGPGPKPDPDPGGTPVPRPSVDVTIIDFDASDLRFMRDADSPDDLMVYFRDRPDISLRVEEHFDEGGATIPAVKGIKFHDGETLSLENDLVLEGTEEDEVIRASYHEDLLIGGGGDDVFQGTSDELDGDHVTDIVGWDAIEVLDVDFEYKDIDLEALAEGRLSIDYNADGLTDIIVHLDDYQGNGVSVSRIEGGGTRVDFNSMPTEIWGTGLAVEGGAIVDLSRLFLMRDVDRDIETVNVTLSIAELDLSQMEQLFIDNEIEKAWGISLEEYRSGVLASIEALKEQFNIADGATEGSRTFTYDEFKDFSFASPGVWLNPGEKLEEAANLYWTDQAFRSVLSFDAYAVDRSGNHSVTATSKLYTDRYKDDDEVLPINWDGLGFSLGAVGAGTASLEAYFEKVMTTFGDHVDDNGHAYFKEGTIGADNKQAWANILNSKGAKFAFSIFGKMSDGITIFSMAVNKANIDLMSDREYEVKNGGKAVSIAFSTATDIWMSGISIVNPLAAFAFKVAMEVISVALDYFAIFERVVNYIYEVIVGEDPGEEGYSLESVTRDLELVADEVPASFDSALEKTEVMRDAGELWSNTIMVEISMLAEMQEQLAAATAHAERIHLVGSGLISMVQTDAGVLVTYEGEDGTQTHLFEGKDLADITHHETFEDYSDEASAEDDQRFEWENWVRPGDAPVTYEARDHDDLLIGSRGDDHMTLRGGDDEVYGAEGGDSFVIDGTGTAESDSFRFVDLNFDEGDRITFRGFGTEYVISSREELQNFIDAGYADAIDWEDESGDIDVTFRGLDANLSDLPSGPVDPDPVDPDPVDPDPVDPDPVDPDPVDPDPVDPDPVDPDPVDPDPVDPDPVDPDPVDPDPVDPDPVDPDPVEPVEPITGGDDGGLVSGTDGDDRIIGGIGHDAAMGGAGNDQIDTGDGYDLVRGGDGDDSIAGGHGFDHLFGDKGADLLLGGAGIDRLSGGTGHDTLHGGGGHDWLAGGSGNDSMSGGAGWDQLFGGSGDDILDGGAYNDFLVGGTGNDHLLGGAGRDMLQGSDGDDTLNGGAGDDRMFGGAGADTFMFQEGSGTDTVHDFDIREDLLQFSGSPDGYEGLRVSSGTDGITISGFDDAGSEIFLSGVHLIDEDRFIFS